MLVTRRVLAVYDDAPCDPIDRATGDPGISRPDRALDSSAAARPLGVLWRRGSYRDTNGREGVLEELEAPRMRFRGFSEPTGRV
jgi:hypothetical protein